MKPTKKRKLPNMDSVRELAEFWDTHDLTEFGELEEVEGTAFARETPIRLELKETEAQALRRLAERKGVSEGELVREWVQEKLGRAKCGKRRAG